MTQRQGYAGKILRVNLSTGFISTIPTETYAMRFLGGRGIAAKIHWDEVSSQIGAFDPENRLVMMSGPLCGVAGFAGSRWQVSGKSPYRNRFSYCNMGGTWGAQLKFAGYDGLVIHGKSDKLTYLLIDNNKVELKDASLFQGKGAIYTREKLKEELGTSFCVMAIGAAGENTVNFATLLADSDSSGSSGLGAIMGSKKLKAVVVRGKGKIEVSNMEKVRSLRQRVQELRDRSTSWPTMLPKDQIKKEVCFGCINGCIRQTYTAENGHIGKYMCQAAVFYEVRALRYYGKVTEVSFLANKLCDDYGLDTRPVETMIMWLSRCHKAGILTEESTKLPLSKIGSAEFIETLLHKISFREGFGDILAAGTLKAAESVGKDSKKLITDYMIHTGENEIYGPRLYLTTGLFYAMEPRMPIQQLHEISALAMRWAAREMGVNDNRITTNLTLGTKENYLTSGVLRDIAKRFWGSEVAADFSTYEGKAMAATKIQDRQYVKESLILCDLSWPIMSSASTCDHVGDPTLESQVCTAVTGIDVDEEGLYQFGERIFNLQRAILVREGQKGREHDTIDEFNFTESLRGDVGNPDCIVPGKDGEIFSRKGMVVGRDEFENMKDEFYALRGWDVSTGLQTKTKLEDLDLSDVAQILDRDGLIV